MGSGSKHVNKRLTFVAGPTTVDAVDISTAMFTLLFCRRWKGIVTMIGNQGSEIESSFVANSTFQMWEGLGSRVCQGKRATKSSSSSSLSSWNWNDFFLVERTSRWRLKRKITSDNSIANQITIILITIANILTVIMISSVPWSERSTWLIDEMRILPLLLHVGFLVLDTSHGRRNDHQQQDHQLLQKREIHLAGIFPINGVEGWQGGQVKYFRLHFLFFFHFYLFGQEHKPFMMVDGAKSTTVFFISTINGQTGKYKRWH